jgi:hypothetical protein
VALEELDRAFARGLGFAERATLPQGHRELVLRGGSVDSCEHGS